MTDRIDVLVEGRGMTTVEAAAEPVVELSTRRERVGWYFYGWADHAFYTTVIAVVIAPYMTSIAEHAADAAGNVHPFGITVASGSYYPYLVSLATLISVFTLPTLGAVADRSRHKRRLLAGAATLGVASTMAFFFVTGNRYLLGGLLYLLATISLNGGAVVYNSFLPQLVGPDKRDVTSSIGWSLGYIGGGLHLLTSLALFQVYGTGSQMVRWVMVSAGVWWGLFAIVSLVRLKDRDPVLDPTAVGGNVVTASFKQLLHTFRGMRAYPLTLLFLAAFLIYNDGIQTVISQASLYADKELGIETSVLAVTILIIQFVAFGGALLLGLLAKVIGAWKTILLSLVAWTGVIVAAYYLPAHDPGKFMAVGAAIGLVLGGSQALSRSLFSQMIPRGREGEYFGFYALADKGMSWSGPLVFGIVYQTTHHYRTSIFALLAFFVIGFVILLTVPVRRAIIAAGNTPPKRL